MSKEDYDKNIEVMKELRDRIDRVLAGQPQNSIFDGTQKHPDPIKHKYISFVKSALRIVAGGCFVMSGFAVMHGGWIIAGGALIIMAEILGIAEEMV